MARKNSKSIKDVVDDPYAMPPGSVFVLTPEQMNDPVRRANALREAELASKYQLTTFQEMQRWPNLFILYSASDGSYSAMLDGKLEEHYDAVTAGVDAESGLLMDALSALDKINPNTLKDLLKTVRSSSSPKFLAGGNHIHFMKGPESSPLDLERLIVLVSNLKESIGPQLHRMHYFREGPHEDAAMKVIKTFEKSVKAWNRRSLFPASHGNADMFPYGKDHAGRSLKRPLPWLAIEVARELVEKKQDLPTKGELIQELNTRFKKLKSKQPSFWTALLKKAGLSSLPRTRPWGNVKRKAQEKVTERRADTK